MLAEHKIQGKINKLLNIINEAVVTVVFQYLQLLRLKMSGNFRLYENLDPFYFRWLRIYHYRGGDESSNSQQRYTRRLSIRSPRAFDHPVNYSGAKVTSKTNERKCVFKILIAPSFIYCCRIPN